MEFMRVLKLYTEFRVQSRSVPLVKLILKKKGPKEDS